MVRLSVSDQKISHHFIKMLYFRHWDLTDEIIWAKLCCRPKHSTTMRIRKSTPFLTTLFVALSLQRSTAIHLRHNVLTHRGGSSTNSQQSPSTAGANDAKPKPQFDLATWSRMRIQSDPSSIPLMALLSKRYLNVPLNSNGHNVQPLGLTIQERQQRLPIYGRNELEQPPERTLLSFIIEQFDDKLVRILLVVALASGILGMLELKDEMKAWAKHAFKKEVVTSTSIAADVVERATAKFFGSPAALSVAEEVAYGFGFKQIIEALIEPIVISTILVINALVGGYQSLNASKGISALKKMQASKAVLRLLHNKPNGHDTMNSSIEEIEVDASSLVPGDIVVLSVGQKIPADIRLISVSTSTFTVDEASLTGESDSVPKVPYVGDVIEGDEEHKDHVIDDLDEIQEGAGSMGKHANGMLYSGTVITAGKGIGVVVRTGMSTEMGKVSCCCLDMFLFFFA